MVPRGTLGPNELNLLYWYREDSLSMITGLNMSHCVPRSQEEMAHTCRGTVNLAGAFIDNIDSTNFVITNGPQVRGTVESFNLCENQ